METTLQVTKKMKDFNIDRRTEPVLAIGGGVCLDVVGLAASLFQRRTPYIRVPTTALAYVDASVGAKNGVNFAGSKNRLRTYVPLCAALLDPMFIETQADREVANGVGEMCKMAIMKSPELCMLLEVNGQRLVKDKLAPCSQTDDAPARVLQLAIETMLEELSPNLWENSLDRLVDFGHAVGHDLKMAALGTKRELLHGESVTVDMAFSTVLSQQVGLITKAERDRMLSMLRNCQLPIWSPIMTAIEHAVQHLEDGHVDGDLHGAAGFLSSSFPVASRGEEEFVASSGESRKTTTSENYSRQHEGARDSSPLAWLHDVFVF